MDTYAVYILYLFSMLSLRVHFVGNRDELRNPNKGMDTLLSMMYNDQNDLPFIDLFT